MFGQILTAIATPFSEDESVDEDAFATLCRSLIDDGSHGLVVAGTTGEASTLTDEEKIRLCEIAVSEVGDRASIIAGTGSNDTAHSVHLTEAVSGLGVDGVLAVTPYYNRPPRAGLIGHFGAMAAVGLPVVLYNIPGRTSLNMPPDVVCEIAEIDGVVALKQANEDLDETRAIMAGSDLAIYAGNADLLLPVMELGGAGVISVVSHLVAPQLAAIAEAVEAGDPERAAALDAELAGLYSGLFVNTNPILIKAALEMRGQIPSARVRLPLVEATPVERDILRTVLDAQGIGATATG